MTGKTKVNELSLRELQRTGFSLAPWVQCVWRFSLQQDAYTGGMSIPFVDPWERSSISLLGTALMRPGILPFIPHSLQLGTAHSFRYGHNGVFVHTDTMQWAKSAHSPVAKQCLHMPPLIYLEYCTLQDPVLWILRVLTVDIVFVCASHCSKWIPCQRIPRKVIWSWFADLADMECITFLEFREENHLSNANQIYFPAVFIQTSIHDSSIPHDALRKVSETQSKVLFFSPKRMASHTGSL